MALPEKNQSNLTENQNIDTTPGSKPSRTSKNRAGWLFIVVALVIMLIISLTSKRPTLNWAKDLPDAMSQARNQHKLVLLVLHSIEVPDCTKIKQATYSDSRVRKFVAKNFVPVLFEVQGHEDLATQYGITRFPAHIVINPVNGKFSSVSGFAFPKNLITHLKEKIAEVK